MFYCEKCRKEKGWPKSLVHSRGKCEVCRTKAVCHSLSTYIIRKRRKQKERAREVT